MIRCQALSRTATAAMAAIFVLAGLQACNVASDGNKPEAHGSGGSASLHLQLRPAALLSGVTGAGNQDSAGPGPVIDSVALRISGDGMDTLAFGFSGDSLALTLDDLPPGDHRQVSADLFHQGRHLYSGSAACAFQRESRLELSLACQPLFARVSAAFHLPIGLKHPIASGHLTLTGQSGVYSQALIFRDEFASVSLDEVAGGEAYDVSLALLDAEGKTQYASDRSAVFLPQGQAAQWDLALLPAAASADLTLALRAAPEDAVGARFPSRSRGPAASGELVIAAFYPAPTAQDSSSDGEWFTLFNRTADTLRLDGCRLGRDRSLGVTHAFAFAAGQGVAPGRALMFGRAAAAADAHYADFQMTNAGGSLLLLCGDALIDSLRYSTAAADSLTSLPSKEGWATALDRYALGRRGEPAGWCLTHASPNPAGAAVIGNAAGGFTPDGLGICAGQ